MRLIVPISVGGWPRMFTRWDVLAVLLILGLLVFFAEASRHLLQPLTELQLKPVSLDPANLPEYAARTTLRMLIAMVLSLLVHFYLRDPRGQEQAGGTAAGPASRHPSIGADPWVHFHHHRVLHGARAGPCSWRRIRGDLRDFHQPSLEHGIQLLSIAAHSARGTGRGVAQFPAQSVDAFLARRCAIRDAAADLEHDVIDVRRLVFRRCLRGDQRRQHDDHAAGRRLLHRACHRTSGSRRPSAMRSSRCSS